MIEDSKALSPSWRLASTGTSSLLFGVDVVNPNTVWAVGQSPGVVVRTVDGGRSWQDITPPGGRRLIFHDVEAFDRNHAVVLGVLEDEPSRIFYTDDGRASFPEVFRDEDDAAFYNSMAFFDHRRGLAFSDPVGGFFRIVSTDDGGQTWSIAPTDGMPPAITDNGQRAEFGRGTGTSLVTMGPHDAWFGTDPLAASARVFRTEDDGDTWTVVTTPIPGDPEFGIASLSFRDRQHGLALGGGVFESDAPSVVAVTIDGGETWIRAGSLAGFRISIASAPTNIKETAVAVGPSGSDFSTDSGQTWTLFDDETDLRGINCKPHVACWAVGAGGMAAELTFT
jgi:photosystem II stability/assembly factor-like uncharacterized protein